jgi:hypothetical protein
MSGTKLHQIFDRRFFAIPPYQRNYSWEREHIRALLEDIKDAMATDCRHFLGQIVLSKTSTSDDLFFVVDGQQRLTTIVLILNDLISRVSGEEAPRYMWCFIRDGLKHRLTLQSPEDQTFFEGLIGRANPTPMAKTKSQKRLLTACEEIGTYRLGEGNELKAINFVEKLDVLEYIEENESDAIRIFLTVNDRGKELSDMDRAKSLLFYFSNRYVNKTDNKLDSKINARFGDIFQLYDEIKDVANSFKITQVSTAQFTENNLLTHHFAWISQEEFGPSSAYVLKYLKKKLDNFRDQRDYEGMAAFINHYIEGLFEFVTSFRSALGQVESNVKYFKLFVVLGISPALYPVVAKLRSLDLLDRTLPGLDLKGLTFLDLLEVIQVRIYSFHDWRAELYRYIADLKPETDVEHIKDWLLSYNQSMSSEKFRTNLDGPIYKNYRGILPYLFLEHSESRDSQAYSLSQWKRFSEMATMEHILSQTPRFSPDSFGFEGEKDFVETEHKLGNLTVLEGNLNKGNLNPTEKVEIYEQSAFRSTRELSTIIAKEHGFTKQDIDRRQQGLLNYCSQRWWFDPPTSASNRNHL